MNFNVKQFKSIYVYTCMWPNKYNLTNYIIELKINVVLEMSSIKLNELVPMP